MKKIGIFYGPVGGATERVAHQIKEAFGNANIGIDIYPIRDSTATMVNLYDCIILGCSSHGVETWRAEQPKNGWNDFRPEIDKVEVSGKLFAFFGIGDHLTYARNFVDGMGVLAKMLIARGAQVVGQCSTEGYEFIESEALIGGKFIGLPIDEDFEPEKTTLRVERWVKELAPKLL